MEGEARLRLADDVTHQSLGEGNDTVILSLKSGYLYTCNETAAAFLGALDGERTLNDVIDLLEEEFEAPRGQMAGDFAALADELVREKLIVISRAQPAAEKRLSSKREGEGNG
jgi:pyrroloquinoline quinone biosynthesis protein D